MSNINNSVVSNPFSFNNVKRVNSIVPSGTYDVRVVSMKCWTHSAQGEEHVLPSMGLIAQLIGDPRQVKITLVCPESAESHQRYATKVGAVLQACKMEPSDFYNVEEGVAGDALTVHVDEDRHPNCPVGKMIRIQVKPDFVYERDNDGEHVTPAIYKKVVGSRDLRPTQFWDASEKDPVLCRYTGYHSLVRVF